MKTPRHFISVIVSGIFLTAAACSRDDPPTPPSPESSAEWSAFNQNTAFDDVETLTGFGSRASGAPGHRHANRFIQSRLKAADVRTVIQEFTTATPGGDITFRTIEGIISGAATGIIIVSTHYDGRYDASPDFQSANSAGSGPAVLLEIARVLNAGYDGSGPEIRLVFFDGQEPLTRHTSGDGLRGSKYYLDRLIEKRDHHRVIAVINLDMVGDRDLTITIPKNVSSWLRHKLLEAAHQENARTYFRLFPAEIGDDHDPFFQARIPAINIIDFEYGSAPGRNDYWRTADDTLDKISPDSLGIIGRVTLRLIRDLVSGRTAIAPRRSME